MVPCQRTRKLKATLTNANRTFPNMTSSTEDERLIPTIKRALTLHCGIILLCKTNMAARFPASASMQRMANNPQQASMFQRSQFQQSPYGMARPANSSSAAMSMRVQGTSGMHAYGPNVPRAGLVPGAAAALEQARRRQDAKNRRRKKKMSDKILPQRVRDLVPESQAYMDLLAFERKLDATIMRKRLDIQEALKRPMKQKKKLRIYLTTNFYVPRPENEDEENIVPSWELRVEGRLLEETQAPKTDGPRQKRKFSTYFKSLVIELDRELYGPDNHLVEWHRTSSTQETDGFQVKRPGEENVKCTIMFLLDYQPPQYKLEPRLARLMGIHTQTRPVIVNAIWQYIKSHNLQDSHEREYINCDRYFQQIFECNRMKFSEIPQRLSALLLPPDPIVIHHLISKETPENKRTTCYDIEVEVDDTLKAQMQSFLLSTASQNEIAAFDNKIYETVETINQLKINREFFLGFARDPPEFINQWIQSQSQDLKVMTDVVGNPEEERRADFFHLPWSQEAVCRYFYGKVQQKRAELEQALGIRGT